MNSLSSTSTISGKRVDRSPRFAEAPHVRLRPRVPATNAGAFTASTPGNHDARIVEPVRQAQSPAAACVGNVRRGGPTAAITTFDPSLRPRARVVERVDRRARLEVQVARPVDPFEQMPEEAGDVVDVELRGVLLGDDAQDTSPATVAPGRGSRCAASAAPRAGVAARTGRSVRCRSPAAADARRPRRRRGRRGCRARRSG